MLAWSWWLPMFAPAHAEDPPAQPEAPPARADEHGLVARLEVHDPDVSGSAFIVLTPPSGEPKRIEVKDDGAPPDVTASDGIFSGAMWLTGDQFTVTVEAGGKTLDAGPVSWSASDTARDLAVAIRDGSVTAEAGVSGSGVGGDPAPGANGASTTGGPSGAAATPPTPGGPTPPGTPATLNPMGEPGDGTLYIGLGLGILVLVGVAWLWVRGRPAEGAAAASGLPRVPEPGLLGPGTPSLSDGLQVWIVQPDDADAIVRPLLATMARWHRVLVVAPAQATVPSVYGGPVHRAPNARPSHVGDAADALQREGGAVAVLFHGTASDAATVRDYADLLPTGVGSVCVLTGDPGVPALPRVTARRDGPVWVVTTAERTLRLEEGPEGLREERRP